MSWVVGQVSSEREVAAQASLIYATAPPALRVGEGRTLAQWTIVDSGTAVAMDAIIGRTAERELVGDASANAARHPHAGTDRVLSRRALKVAADDLGGAHGHR